MVSMRTVVIAVAAALCLAASSAHRVSAEAGVAGQPIVCEYEGSMFLVPGAGIAGDSGTWNIGSGGAGINPLCVAGGQLVPVTIGGSGNYTSAVCGTFLLTGTVQITVAGTSQSLPVSIATTAFAGAWLSSSGTTVLAGPIALLPSGATCFLDNVQVFQIDGALVGTI